MLNKGDSSDAARAQVGANGGLSQRWREEADNGYWDDDYWSGVANCARELDAAKLRIEEAVKALGVQFAYDAAYDRSEVFFVDREAVLKIIREIL